MSMAASQIIPNCSFLTTSEIQPAGTCCRTSFYQQSRRCMPVTASRGSLDQRRFSGLLTSSSDAFRRTVAGSPSRDGGQCCCSAEDTGLPLSDRLSDDSREANKPGRNPLPTEALRYRSKLEHLYHSDTAVPEEEIEKPHAVADMKAKNIGSHSPCPHCQCVGVVECATCEASGLYVEPILESQGIIVKVRCMGCGGSGSLMCSKCGGRGHL